LVVLLVGLTLFYLLF